MKRIKYWVLRLSIRKKLVFYTYLIITPILLLISVLLFLHNYKTVIQGEEDTCFSSVQGLSDNIESMQKNIMEIGTYICINDDITNILTTDTPSTLNQDAQLWFHNAPMQLIQDMIAINGQIKTLAIYPENGVNPFLRCMDYSSYIGSIGEVRKQEIYQLAVQEKGKTVWQRVGKYQSDTYQSNRNDKIVMYREIFDLAKRNKLGYLVIGASADKFDEVCRNSLRNEKEAVLVISEHGATLLSCGDISQDIILDIITLENELSSKKELLSSSVYGKYNMYRCKNKETGIAVYKLVPKQSLAEILLSAVYTPLILLMGLLVCLYPIMLVVSNLVSKPLHALGIAMENFKKGDFSQKVEVTTLDEVGEACACFNNMVDDIKQLIDKNYVLVLKERESELDVLQAQINPHFLYNTLDSLYWRALDADAEEIGEDILALSQLFRLVLNRGNSIVTVRSESELLERYLHIQKMRFGERLDYKILMNDLILEEEIPKLILQPFVENAIVHGFEKGNTKFYLSVTGELENERMIFYVRDTGVGMSKEQVDAIWEEADARNYASQRIGKYAIKNVRERLELTYESDFKLQIESEKGKGTTVMISIPCKIKE